MLTVLLRSQPDVRERLFDLVDRSPRPLLVAQERDLTEGGPFERRMPYRHLLEHGADVSIVLVADDGHQGLWRDPVGDLAEREFSGKDDIAAATSGILIYRRDLDPTYLRRDLWEPANDVRALVARLRLNIPVPERPKAQAERPRFRRPPPPRDPAAEVDTEVPEASSPESIARDPFAVLGLSNTASEEEVKRAFRELVVQYHPDKVAHLAPEFQKLAEEKTLVLTAAYEAAKRHLRGEPTGEG